MAVRAHGDPARPAKEHVPRRSNTRRRSWVRMDMSAAEAEPAVGFQVAGDAGPGPRGSRRSASERRSGTGAGGHRRGHGGGSCRRSLTPGTSASGSSRGPPPAAVTKEWPPRPRRAYSPRVFRRARSSGRLDRSSRRTVGAGALSSAGFRLAARCSWTSRFTSWKSRPSTCPAMAPLALGGKVVHPAKMSSPCPPPLAFARET